MVSPLSLLCFLSLVLAVRSTSGLYDSFLNNTQWFVPSSSLLAYDSFGSLTTMMTVASQNVFNITSCVDGQLTGTNNITTVLSPNPPSYTPSTFTGQVEADGSLTLQMMTAGSSRLMYWHGHVLTETVQLQIQMMSAGGGMYMNHWMYLNQTTADTVLPAVSVTEETANATGQVANYLWMLGSNWTLVSPALFPDTSTASFYVSGYYNGYFWGSGHALSASTGQQVDAFTFFASVVPQGRLLFDVLITSTNELAVYFGNVTFSSSSSSSEEVVAAQMSMMNCSITSIVGPSAYATLIVDDQSGDDDSTDLPLVLGLSLGLGLLVLGAALAAYYLMVIRPSASKPMAGKAQPGADTV